MPGREVPVAAFQGWLSEHLVAAGVWDAEKLVPVKDAHLDGIRSINEIAEDWGLSPRTILRVLRSEQATIGEDKVDRVLTRAGQPYRMRELYGGEE